MHQPSLSLQWWSLLRSGVLLLQRPFPSKIQSDARQHFQVDVAGSVFLSSMPEAGPPLDRKAFFAASAAFRMGFSRLLASTFRSKRRVPSCSRSSSRALVL